MNIRVQPRWTKTMVTIVEDDDDDDDGDDRTVEKKNIEWDED